MARRRLTLTTRGALALAIAPVSALAGLLLGAEELVLLSIALGTLLLSGLGQSARRARWARGNWRITVQLGSVDTQVGRPLDLSVTLATAGRGGAAPIWLEEPDRCWTPVRRAGLSGPTGWSLPSQGRSLRVPSLDNGAVERFAFAAPTGRRGVYALRGLRLWCPDSFGLVAQQVAVGPSATITVHPAPAAVDVAEALLLGDRGTDEYQPVAAAPTRRDNFGDFSGLRVYVPGDRLRLLYWPALARTGELMVRDFEDSGPHRVHLVADIRPALGDAGCERVLAAAAGVGLQVLARGSVVEFSTTSGERVAIGPGPLAERALLRAIAAVETTPAPPPSHRRRRRRPEVAPRAPERDVHAVTGSPLVVTTREGAASMPASLGFAHVVVAP
jgi:uncharacterized protein (DUF58 family)